MDNPSITCPACDTPWLQTSFCHRCLSVIGSCPRCDATWIFRLQHDDLDDPRVQGHPSLSYKPPCSRHY